MDAAVWGLIGVVVGGLITGIVSLGAEYLRGKQDADLDGKKRQDDRRIKLDDIQRSTLLELQERYAEWKRAVGKMQSFDMMTLRKHGGLTQMPEDLSQELFHASRRVMYLVDRVKDDELRNGLRAVTARATEMDVRHAIVGGTITEAELDADFFALVEQGNAADERLGEALRSYL